MAPHDDHVSNFTWPPSIVALLASTVFLAGCIFGLSAPLTQGQKRIHRHRLVGRLTQGILFWLAVILLHRCRFCPDMTLTLALPFRVGREVSAGVWPLPRAGPSPRHFCAGHRLCSGPALTLPWAATLQRLVPLTWAPEPCRRRATFALSS